MTNGESALLVFNRRDFIPVSYIVIKWLSNQWQQATQHTYGSKYEAERVADKLQRGSNVKHIVCREDLKNKLNLLPAYISEA